MFQNTLLRWMIFAVASGSVFFVGVALLAFGFCLNCIARGRRFANVPLIVGVIFVGLSSTPFPWWMYTVLAAISLIWLVVDRVPRVNPGRSAIGLRVAVVLAWSAATVWESAYWVPPSLPPAAEPTLTIYADSVTAGTDDPSIATWPQVLAAQRAIRIVDHSRMGATVASMRRIAAQHPPENGIVLVELGGNDIFGTTNVAEYERELDALLGEVSGPGRLVVMLELPLPPFYNTWGLAQRRLAARHHVRLVPKYVFANVLTTAGSTTDSIHLSAQGHRLMSQTLWRILRDSFDSTAAGPPAR